MWGHDNLYWISYFIGGTTIYVGGGTTPYLGYDFKCGDGTLHMLWPSVNMFHFSPNLISSQHVTDVFSPHFGLWFLSCLPSIIEHDASNLLFFLRTRTFSFLV